MKYIPLLLLFLGCSAPTSRPALEVITSSCEITIREAPPEEKEAIGRVCLALVDAWERGK